jgi:hypothetical protein
MTSNGTFGQEYEGNFLSLSVDTSSGSPKLISGSDDGAIIFWNIEDDGKLTLDRKFSLLDTTVCSSLARQGSERTGWREGMERWREQSNI